MEITYGLLLNDWFHLQVVDFPALGRDGIFFIAWKFITILHRRAKFLKQMQE